MQKEVIVSGGGGGGDYVGSGEWGVGSGEVTEERKLIRS